MIAAPKPDEIGFAFFPNIALQAFGGCLMDSGLLRVREVEKELKGSTVRTGGVMSGCTQQGSGLASKSSIRGVELAINLNL